MKCVTSLSLVGCLALGSVLSGCAEPDGGASSLTPGKDRESQSGHSHPSTGPHGGDLIELGNEEYHAELLHPEHDQADGDHQDRGAAAGLVTVYILDGEARQTVSIEAAEVTLNVVHDDQPQQFKLPAAPVESDSEGRSSRFQSDDAGLLEHMTGEHVSGTLVVEIDGKSYRGKLQHSH